RLAVPGHEGRGATGRDQLAGHPRPAGGLSEDEKRRSRATTDYTDRTDNKRKREEKGGRPAPQAALLPCCFHPCHPCNPWLNSSLCLRASVVQYDSSLRARAHDGRRAEEVE